MSQARVYSGIGLMSGTSLDGIDLAYCRFEEGADGWRFTLECAETVPYDEKWYARLRCLDEQDAEAYAKTHVYFGHHLGRALADFIARHELKPDFVASHGQTVFHQPGKNFTAQIGDGETMASYLPCPLVTNFRNKDVALGGQGAPLVPFGERLLFPGHRLFLNLGGIANLSYGDLAFDVCPCNMALNWLALQAEEPQPYDEDGRIARSGQSHPGLMAALEGLEYYKQGPPKSLGAEWYARHVLPLISDETISVADRMATVVIHIARQVAAAAKQVGAQGQPILISGGGAHNTTLMAVLDIILGRLDIHPVAVAKEVIDYKEALIFAFLGLQTLLGRPNALASVTGARLDVCGGSIHLPPGGWHKSLL